MTIQCLGFTLNGIRCNHTTKNGYCYQHKSQNPTMCEKIIRMNEKKEELYLQKFNLGLLNKEAIKLYEFQNNYYPSKFS